MRYLILIIFFNPFSLLFSQTEKVSSVTIYAMNFNIESRYGYGFNDVIESVNQNLNSKSYDKKFIDSETDIGDLISDINQVKEGDSYKNVYNLRLVVILDLYGRTDTLGFDYLGNVNVNGNWYQKQEGQFEMLPNYLNCSIRRSIKKSKWNKNLPAP